MGSTAGGHAYGQFTAQDHTRVVAGNVYGDVTFKGEKNSSAETPEDRCRRLLFVTFTKAHRASLLSKKGSRVEGTCTWVQEAPLYQTWLRDDPRLLWICGGPGKGKTMLSIYLSEELERIADQSNGTRAIYTFCSSGDERTNTAVGVLKGLISQMIEWRHELASRLVNYFTDDKRGQESVSSREVLWSMFTNLCQDPGTSKLYCILDGLDECDVDSGTWLARRLKVLLCDDSTNALQLVVLSRNDMHLRQILAQQATIDLDTSGDKSTADDVETFVVARVNELRRIEGFDEEMIQDVTKVFLERADTSFLWVGFVMEEMSNITTCTEVYETLESLKTLPKGLDALYERMLLNIPSGRREKAYEILLWVATALRPLRLDELADAVDAQSVGRMSPEQVVRDRITWCGSFLSIRAEPIDASASDCNWTHPDHQIEYKIVNLVHHSARDYLLDENSYNVSTLGSYRTSPRIGHFEAMQRCLDILKQADIQDSTQIDRCDCQAAYRNSGLLHYAIYRWVDHLLCLPYQKAEAIIQRNNFFSYDSGIASKWFTQYSYPRFAASQTFGPLFVASHMGIVSWVRHILASAIEHGENLSGSEDEIYGSREIDRALECAILQGHEGVMGLLLYYGASPTLIGFGTIFKSRHQPTAWILKRLRDCVADIHTKDSLGRTLLMDATEYGTMEAMIVLLNCESDGMAHTAMRDIWENNILHAAVLSRRDAKGKLRYLIEQANSTPLINLPNGEGKTPLHAIVAPLHATYEHDYTVSLVEHGYAVSMWEEETSPDAVPIGVAQILLENGADVNAVDREGETPLYTAYAYDFLDSDLIELLRSHGASVGGWNDQDASFEPMPDHWAVGESSSPNELQSEVQEMVQSSVSERLEPDTGNEREEFL